MITLEDLLTSDTLQPHDAPPHGVPTAYDWQSGPVIQAGGDPGTCGFFNPWGQVYIPADGSYNMKGAKAEIREMRAYLLSRSEMAWRAAYVTWPGLTGSLYTEDFQGPQIGASISTARPGSIMATPAQVNGIGYLFHFYPAASRAEIDPDDICGVAVTCRMRLALVNPDLGAPPRLLANVGADYWPGATGGNVRGVGQGRLKWLDESWRLFGFTTMPHVPMVLADQSELR